MRARLSGQVPALPFTGAMWLGLVTQFSRASVSPGDELDLEQCQRVISVCLQLSLLLPGPGSIPAMGINAPLLLLHSST